MNKVFLLIVLVVAATALSGCVDGPNTDYYNGGSQGDGEECGDFEEECCVWVGTDDFGAVTARSYCNDGLDCRAEICVEGPDYGSYGRPTGYN